VLIMPSVDQTVRVYQELANFYVQQGQAQMRDRFLVLAAEAMYSAGRTEEAERLRGRLLQVNPHHLFKPFASLSEAMKSADVKNYLEGLRRTYPPEKAAHLLESLRSGKEESPSPRGPGEQSRPTKPTVLPETPAEPIKVFRIKEEDESPASPVLPPGSRPLPRPAAREKPRPAPEPVVRPATPIPAARPVSPAQVASVPPIWPEANPPSPWQPRAPEADRPEPMVGAWVANCLFWVLLLASLALAVYSLGGPFLPL
jgi:hypothetical protein